MGKYSTNSSSTTTITALHHPEMAPPPPWKSILTIAFLFNLVLVQSKLNLDRSNQLALLNLQEQLGVQAENGCNAAGIFCSPKGFTSSSYMLKITRIIYKSRNLKGTLPTSIGKLTELKQLSLSSNHLFGEIPPQISKCRKLEILELGNNGFSGEVSAGFSSLTRLRVLDLSFNKLSGDLNFLKYLVNLEEVSLAGNLFTGKIPLSLNSFRNLRRLNVSGNTLIDYEDSGLSEIKDSKKNYLTKRFVFVENSFINASQSTAVAPSSGAQPNNNRKHKKKKKKALAWIIGFLAGSLSGVLTGLIISVLFRIISEHVKQKHKQAGLAIFSPLIKKPEVLAFLQNEDGIESLEVIGQGGCGIVYKAELPGSNGKQIAIKKIIQPSKDAAELTVEDSKVMNKKMRQIKSEIQTVGQIRHRNLLPLLAHIPRPDCHYLVYEYMKNGSLQDWLEKSCLDWLTRYKIAVGIATGLEYLHLDHKPHIIHRDLKPANVLLDDDMEARIADFGLAKAMPDAYTHFTSTNVVGTLGYIAPEYHQTLKFTDKCDIYSFGVMLGALVMGKLPTDEFFQDTEEMNLAMWMRNTMASGEPKKAIDPMLLGNGFEEQMLLVLKIACFCTLQNPKERPNSKDVRIMLSQIDKIAADRAEKFGGNAVSDQEV